MFLLIPVCIRKIILAYLACAKLLHNLDSPCFDRITSLLLHAVLFTMHVNVIHKLLTLLHRYDY